MTNSALIDQYNSTAERAVNAARFVLHNSDDHRFKAAAQIILSSIIQANFLLEFASRSLQVVEQLQSTIQSQTLCIQKLAPKPRVCSSSIGLKFDLLSYQDYCHHITLSDYII